MSRTICNKTQNIGTNLNVSCNILPKTSSRSLGFSHFFLWINIILKTPSSLQLSLMLAHERSLTVYWSLFQWDCWWWLVSQSHHRWALVGWWRLYSHPSSWSWFLGHISLSLILQMTRVYIMIQEHPTCRWKNLTLAVAVFTHHVWAFTTSWTNGSAHYK